MKPWSASSPADASAVSLGAVSNLVPEPPSEEAGAQPGNWHRMSVAIGQWQLLIPADRGREVIALPSFCRIPHTAPWLRGLANVRGNLVPAVDMSMVLGTTAARGRQEYLLILNQGEAAIGVLIHGLPRLVNLETAVRAEACPVDFAPMLKGAVVGCYESDGQVWIDVDLDAFSEAITQNIAM